jgi:hypothetical protein
MKNYNEQLNKIGANVIKDLKKIKNKVLFRGELSEFWEICFEFPQTYILSKYGQQTQYFITELYEDNGELRAKGIDNEDGKEQIFDIYHLSTATLIDILYFEPIENNQ